MKKIIWVFGESATGKKTFIENILSNKNNIRNNFKLNNIKITALKRTILTSEEDKKETISRHDAIISGIQDFLNSNYDLLLIKGQTNDMEFELKDINKQNTLMKSIDMFSNIEQEIILLEIPDNDLSYYRMTQKDWWQEDPEKYKKMIPRKKWDALVVKHKDKVFSFKKYVSNIYEIDTTKGYKLIQ